MKKITTFLLSSLTILSLGLTVSQSALADTVGTQGVNEFLDDHSHNHSTTAPSYMSVSTQGVNQFLDDHSHNHSTILPSYMS